MKDMRHLYGMAPAPEAKNTAPAIDKTAAEKRDAFINKFASYVGSLATGTHPQMRTAAEKRAIVADIMSKVASCSKPGKKQTVESKPLPKGK